MKICILKESLCLGGTERSAANISKALSKEHEVYTTLYDGSVTEYEFGGTLVDFSLPPRNGVFNKVVNNIKRIQKYNRLIKKEQIPLLYEFISINNPISALRHRGQIRIISSRDFSVLSSCAERFRKCLNNADAMVCNSEYLREYYVSRYPEHKDRVYAVYNIIDAQNTVNQSLQPIDGDFREFLANHSDTIVSVGRFCKEKGFEHLIEAFAKARSVNDGLGLVLIGDGNYKSRYNELVFKYGLQDHVYFTGFQNNPYKYMTKCSCFVLSSLSEGFPNVLAEAMALGLPVIAANCHSGPAEILRDDCDYEAVTDSFVECDYGIITPKITETNNENAIDQLAEAVTVLLSDREKMAYYSKKATERAAEFSEDAARTRLNEIFNTLLERRKNSDKNKKRT